MKKVISIICIIIMLIVISAPAYAAKKDTKAPTITKTNPIDYGSDIMIESSIIIRFSEKVLKGKNISKISVKESELKSVGFTYKITDNFLVITPKADLKYKTIYVINIPASAVKDASGNNLKNEYIFEFITELDPATAAKDSQEQAGTKYILEIEATLEEELTDAKIKFFTLALKDFGINAEILDYYEADKK